MNDERIVVDVKVFNLKDLPDLFKIKLPAKYSYELTQVYDFLFDFVVCGWAGRSGHYAYDGDGCEATNQDGYLYCYTHGHSRKLTASCKGNISFDPKKAVEILLKDTKDGVA